MTYKLKLSAALIGLTVGWFTASGPALAQADRAGVLLPERVQLQRAVQAAARLENAPLAEADIPPVVIAESPQDEAPSEIEKEVAEDLDPITLEERIQNQMVQTALDQFGYDIFTQMPTTFAPVEGIPVPPDYLIGPGDTFIIKIYGAVDVEYRLVVTREGRLLVPELGDLQVAGLTFDEVKILLQDEVESSRVGARAVITLAELHTIQVLMVGDVTLPGSYTISGLSSLLNTLVTTGGIKRTGSLRDIQVRRGGELVARMDLYDLLLKGKDESNIYLRQGDVVFVPPIQRTMGVAGEVYRPAIYELKDEQTIDQVLNLAGGLRPKAAPGKSHIERISDSGSRTLVSVDLGDTQDLETQIKNGDLLRVFPIIDKLDNVVILSGHVLEPGGYQWFKGMRISSLIPDRQILQQGIDYDIGLIQREDPEAKRTSVLYFNLGAAMTAPGSDADPELSPRDQVMVFNTHSPRAQQVAGISEKLRRQATAYTAPSNVDLVGFFKHPGTYPLPANTRLLDALIIGGGIQAGTDLDYALLLRENSNTKTVEFAQIKLADALRHPTGDNNPMLLPLDKVYLFDDKTDRSKLLSKDLDRVKKQVKNNERSPIVVISGESRHPGTYPLTPGMRIEDLILAGGGFKEQAYSTSANLSRRSVISGEYSIVDQHEVDLNSASQNTLDGSTILEPYDQLVLRKKPDWIDKPIMATVEGEVRYPGTYQMGKRETLCGLVQRAGGFTEDAYLFGSVFLRESVRKREQEALDEIFNNLDDLLVDVHLSPGFGKDQKLPVNSGPEQTMRAIRGLERHKARGRLVIDVETAVEECREGSDLVLEDGDRLVVPKFKNEVSVVGQVYYPMSHFFREDRAALDYVNLSGGAKELANREHIFILQANGEVLTSRHSLGNWGWREAPYNVKVTPGSTVYVPISVDRINGMELTQSWTDVLFRLSLSAASLDYLFQ